MALQVYERSLGEGSYCYIYEIPDEVQEMFEVWEVPMYGGPERYVDSFKTFEQAVDFTFTLT